MNLLPKKIRYSAILMMQFVLKLAISLQVSTPIAPEIKGFVRDQAGNPLSNVRVFSRVIGSAGPPIVAIVNTNIDGQYKLEGYGRYVIFRHPGYEPLIVQAASLSLNGNVTMQNVREKGLKALNCYKNRTSINYLGPDNTGFIFPISSSIIVHVSRGNHDKSYTIYNDNDKRQGALVYYLSYAELGYPQEELLTASTIFNVSSFRFKNYEGLDVQGQFANGDFWRFVGMDGMTITYRGVPRHVADHFNRIIDSVCYIGY